MCSCVCCCVYAASSMTMMSIEANQKGLFCGCFLVYIKSQYLWYSSYDETWELNFFRDFRYDLNATDICVSACFFLFIKKTIVSLMVGAFQKKFQFFRMIIIENRLHNFPLRCKTFMKSNIPFTSFLFPLCLSFLHHCALHSHNLQHFS